MRFLRHAAFATAAVLLLSVTWAISRGFPPAVPMEFPESRAGAESLLRANGSAGYVAGVEFDQVLIPLYSAQVLAWVAWVALGLGEKERSAWGAAVGAALMMFAAAFWDYQENARMLDLFHSFDAGRISAFELLPLRTAASRKWGYLGLALLLAGIANGFGMWTRPTAGISPRRIRTWACVAGGLAGIAGGSLLVPGLSAPVRWILFQGCGLGLAVAGVTVLIETWPWRTGGQPKRPDRAAALMDQSLRP